MPRPPKSAKDGGIPTVKLGLSVDGLPIETALDVSLCETDGTDDGSRRPECELGKLSGKSLAKRNPQGGVGIQPDSPLPTRDAALAGLDVDAKLKTILVCLVLYTADGPAEGYFRLSDQDVGKQEGDYWEIHVKGKCSFGGKNYDLLSPPIRVAHMPRAVPRGQATYFPRSGNRLEFYNDGCKDATGSEGALKDMVDAIRDAKNFVFVADWSFHPLFRPSRDGASADPSASSTIGAELVKKAKAGVTTAVLTWEHGGLAKEVFVRDMLDQQNDEGDHVLAALAKNPSTNLPANLYWRKTARTGVGNSHHQKMLVVDCQESDGRRGIRVFLGGLDLTKGRFDYSEHPVAPAPSKTAGDGQTWAYAQQWKVDGWHDKDLVDEWYNAETEHDRTLPRQPWHDVHAKLDGPAAWDYLREFVGRWLTISGGSANDDAVWKAYLSLCDRTKFWPPEEPLPDGIWTVQVCRSLEKAHWSVDMPKRTAADLEKGQHWSEAYGFHWGINGAAYEKSIWEAYRRGIDVAERFIYIENQYFIGSGKNWGYDDSTNDIPERLVNKILERRAAGKEFHVYIVMPMFPEGKPTAGSACELRACEWETVKWMIFKLAESMGDDWKKYLSFYFLANWTNVPRTEWVAKGERNERLRKHQRYMIYVHTKMMIVDDRHVILGSCNLNDRGLTGNTDSEIAISAWPRLKNRDDCIAKVRDLRERLWREHLRAGFPEGGWMQPEKAGCVDAVRKKGFLNYRAFREMRRSVSEGHLCLWNYYTDKNEIKVRNSDTNLGVMKSDPIRGSEDNMCLPDSPYPHEKKAKDKGWCWNGDFQLLIPRSLVK
jgi:phospholipase D1/2